MDVKSPPKDDLVRALRPGPELRDDGDDGGPTMLGHFSVFDEWTEIESFWEGNFMERVAPGAFRKTFKENRAEMRSLFQHGYDPQIGDKPLGSIEELHEDDRGAYYEVPLLDAPYVRNDVLPGLKANLYGSSFRFRVMKEEFEEEPEASEHNPKGLPERTVREARVFEFGPVTFPAYASATAGVRSLTDEFRRGRFIGDPRKMLEHAEALVRVGAAALDEEEPEPEKATTPEPASRSTRSRRFATREEFLAWIARP